MPRVMIEMIAMITKMIVYEMRMKRSFMVVGWVWVGVCGSVGGRRGGLADFICIGQPAQRTLLRGGSGGSGSGNQAMAIWAQADGKDVIHPLLSYDSRSPRQPGRRGGKAARRPGGRPRRSWHRQLSCARQRRKKEFSVFVPGMTGDGRAQASAWGGWLLRTSFVSPRVHQARKATHQGLQRGAQGLDRPACCLPRCLRCSPEISSSTLD